MALPTRQLWAVAQPAQPSQGAVWAGVGSSQRHRRARWYRRRSNCGSVVAPPEAQAGGLPDSGEMPCDIQETPLCRGCGVALRPAVLMFGDEDPVPLERL